MRSVRLRTRGNLINIFIFIFIFYLYLSSILIVYCN